MILALNKKFKDFDKCLVIDLSYDLRGNSCQYKLINLILICCIHIHIPLIILSGNQRVIFGANINLCVMKTINI